MHELWKGTSPSVFVVMGGTYDSVITAATIFFIIIYFVVVILLFSLGQQSRIC